MDPLGLTPWSECGDSRTSFNIPLSPTGVDIDKNIEDASKMSRSKFYHQVRNMGVWDYKQLGEQYQDFGNFNYGATGRSAGFPRGLLLRMAGWAQLEAGTSKPEWGNPWGREPYGDDPSDQDMIIQGMDYYDKKHGPNRMKEILDYLQESNLP